MPDPGGFISGPIMRPLSPTVVDESKLDIPTLSESLRVPIAAPPIEVV